MGISGATQIISLISYTRKMSKAFASGGKGSKNTEAWSFSCLLHQMLWLVFIRSVDHLGKLELFIFLFILRRLNIPVNGCCYMVQATPVYLLRTVLHLNYVYTGAFLVILWQKLMRKSMKSFERYFCSWGICYRYIVSDILVNMMVSSNGNISASLAFVRGIHQWRVDSLHTGQ